MLDALDSGEDIGHYGRFVFAMIVRHFVSDDEKTRTLVRQVEDKDYSPPGSPRND